MYKNKKVLVLGMGKSGIAAANLLFTLGAKVIISDSKSKKELEPNIIKLKSNEIEIVTDRHNEKLLKNVDLIIISPGINPNLQIVKLADIEKIEIISEIELAYKICPTKKIIAISGTNGKTTTTTLIGEVLKENFKKVVTCGNIGMPFCEIVTDLKEEDIVVLEVSSFQLERINNFRPYISVLLNITEDHLDRYEKMDDYVKAKSLLFKNQTKEDFAILNFNDPFIKKMKIEATKYFFSSYPITLPAGFVNKDRLILSVNKTIELCKIDELNLKGMHNLENILAASLVAKILNVNEEKIRKSIKEFKGLPHRIEIIREINGVLFVNDSKGTNVDAVVKALDSFSQPVILLMGGFDKKSDFSPIIPYFNKNIKTVVLFGQAKEKIKNSFKNITKIIETDTLKDAVLKAYSISSNGDCIILSPGCASFDMFTDYKQRGEVFRQIVKEL